LTRSRRRVTGRHCRSHAVHPRPRRSGRCWHGAWLDHGRRPGGTVRPDEFVRCLNGLLSIHTRSGEDREPTSFRDWLLAAFGEGLCETFMSRTTGSLGTGVRRRPRSACELCPSLSDTEEVAILRRAGKDAAGAAGSDCIGYAFRIETDPYQVLDFRRPAPTPLSRFAVSPCGVAPQDQSLPPPWPVARLRPRQCRRRPPALRTVQACRYGSLDRSRNP
jgi:hypothetical protein